MKILYYDGISRTTYDINITDAFGNKVLVKVDDICNCLKLFGKNKEFKKRRNALDKMGLKHVIIPEYLEVIDIKQNTLNKIEKLFP